MPHEMPLVPLTCMIQNNFTCVLMEMHSTTTTPFCSCLSICEYVSVCGYVRVHSYAYLTQDAWMVLREHLTGVL